ncbi:hypothetical protein GQ457_02G011540 [Hibiscus cannabinus]
MALKQLIDSDNTKYQWPDSGETEAYLDLGKHCQFSGCLQLDFLPFKCQACLKVFCLEHESCKSHECPKPEHNSRKVIICEMCWTSIEIMGKEDQVKKHDRSIGDLFETQVSCMQTAFLLSAGGN